jgi:hypothetical protein
MHAGRIYLMRFRQHRTRHFFANKGPLTMRSWILIGAILAACSTTTTKSEATPTLAIVPPTVTVAPSPPTPPPTSIPESRLPNVYYQYHPNTQLLEQVTDTAIQPIGQALPARIVVANQDHTVLAIRTLDNTTVLIDVTTAQQSGPFDACDSMAWAPDNTTLWCMRFGYIYSIDATSQTDQLSIATTDDTYWAELIQHPVTNDYWIVVSHDNNSQLCQFNTANRMVSTTCINAEQMPRWSPDGQWLASIADQHLLISESDGSLIARVGLGDVDVLQITWINTTQIAINTSIQRYRYQINDARISLQASDVVIVGR